VASQLRRRSGKNQELLCQRDLVPRYKRKYRDLDKLLDPGTVSLDARTLREGDQ
jgi:transposase